MEVTISDTVSNLTKLDASSVVASPIPETTSSGLDGLDQVKTPSPACDLSSITVNSVSVAAESKQPTIDIGNAKNIKLMEQLPKIQSVTGAIAVRSKLPRIKSDSDIEILSSDEDDEGPAMSSQENDKDTPDDENDKEEMETQSDEDEEEDSDSESDGDIVKMDYTKINSDNSDEEEDEVTEKEDTESDIVLSQESDAVLSQESEKSVRKKKTVTTPAKGESTAKKVVIDKNKLKMKATFREYRTPSWKLKARSIKLLNKRMQIMDENNDTNNDQDKSDLKTLQQSPTQPDGETQKIILAQLKEKFYQQSAKHKAEAEKEAEVKPTTETTTILDDSDDVIEEKIEDPKKDTSNGHDSDGSLDEEELDYDEEELDDEQLTPINGNLSSEKQSQSGDESPIENSPEKEQPLQIDLSSAEEGEALIETVTKPLPITVKKEKEHNHIDFEDLLDNTQQLVVSPTEQEKALPSNEQSDKSKNAIPTASTPIRLPSDTKQHEIPSSQSIVDKQPPAPVVATTKVFKLEDIEDEMKSPPPVPARSRKRLLSVGSEMADDLIVPSKKLKAELDANFGAHDRLLREYIGQSTNNSNQLEDIQVHANLLIQEIQQLNELVRIKETEWNNMVHLKKVKEEILLRLQRKVNLMELTTIKIAGEPEDVGVANPLITNLLSQPFQKHPNRDSLGSLNNTMVPLIASTPSNSAIASGGVSGYGLAAAMEAAAATGNSSSMSSVGSTAANAILQSRANMKSSDLAKEKINAAKVHRNILPKPTLPNHQQILNNLAMSAAQSSAAAAATGGSSTEKAQTAAVAVLNAYHAQLNSLQSQVDLLNGHMPSQSNGGGTLTHQQQQQQNYFNSQIQMGRQGVIKDVKSIIADYRQKHPENVPRRGRRMKGLLGSAGNAGLDSKRLSELGILLSGIDGNSRPSSTESMHSNSNHTPFTTTTAAAANSANNGLTMESLKDVLAQFVTLSQNERNLISSVAASLPTTNSISTSSNFLAGLNLSSALTTTTAANNNNLSSLSSIGKAPPPAYPEVTLHPVAGGNSNFLATHLDTKPNINNNNNNNKLNANNINNNLGIGGNSTTNSLLHGILTKSHTRTNTNFTSSFSPTLARLLTAPERISPQHATTLNAFHQSTSAITPTSNPAGGNASSAVSAALAAASAGLNLSKMGAHNNSEITITPVMSAAAAAAANAASGQSLHMTLLQQQLQQQNRLKQEPFMNMDEEDSADRLVIDESFNDQQHNQSVQEFHENEVPECQGCKKREAQFVCAGCGNQWYCSRECQVTAWDDHSELCTG